MKPQWPSDWSERIAGTGCQMCGSPQADSDQYGLRIHSTPKVDAVLQRARIQRGYTLVIWRGRHAVEPFELADDEAALYWREVLKVAKALAEHYRPKKMNYETLGNFVPHLHTHLIPRYEQDPAPGWPFPLASLGDTGPPIGDEELRPDADALRALLISGRP